MSYGYDALNNLTTVNQGVQTRSFSYSSLSRLLTATNPESGTISYAYDKNGNLTKKTDARGVQTVYVYDELNRVTNRSYSTPGGAPGNYQASPEVAYTYGTVLPAVGRLTKVTTGPTADPVATTEYTEFDILGRVKAHRQTLDDGTYQYETGYVYNLSGALVEETYPSGRKVGNVLDVSGDLSVVKSKKNATSGPYHNYAFNFVYNAAGAVTSMELGNYRYESTAFNSRLQPTQIALGVTQGSTGLLDLDYTYGTTNNNGNVLSQTNTVLTAGSNPGFTAVQNYSYDSLNRLSSADEKPQGWTDANCTTEPTKCWKQTFVYDRYGNRTFDTTANRTTTIPTNCPAAVCNPTANTSDNKLKASDGYVFDGSGNTTADAENRTFFYDGENKQVEVRDSTITPPQNDPDANLIGRYWYDGDGKRVKKYVPPSGTNPGETTIFAYDAAGKLVAEYSTIVADTNTAKVAYLTNDHLGSPRINTDKNGTVTTRHDYHPFGEEITGGQRGAGYADDTVRKQFTGYERDKETELDFAQASYFFSQLGRFSSTDPVLMAPSRAIDPQRINLYVYVRNNPLAFTDSSGRDIDDSSLENDEKYQKWKAAFLSTEAGRALWKKYHENRNFKLIIKNDPKRDNGALTHDFKFKDGQLVGATISLGNDIGDRADAATRRENQYPLTRSLGEERVDSNVLAAGIIAHEFGHVEDASNRPGLWQTYQDYIDLREKRTSELGLQKGLMDPSVTQKLQSVLNGFGAKDIDAVSLDTDPRAERIAIPVIEQSFANNRKKVPERVQKAINKLLGKQK